jgi:hypothetical protein
MVSTQPTARLRDTWRASSPLAAACVALTLLSGCLTKKPEGESVSPVALTYTVPVTVESRFREDLTLFVLHDGMASRLTRINSVSTTRFVIPAHLVGSTGEFGLVLERIGSRSGDSERYPSGRIRVLPGQGLLWTIETRLQQSFLQIVPAETLLPDTVK